MASTADVEAELRALAQEGMLTPEAVVERARSENSALHGYFTWDPKAAAYAHNLSEARALIRSVRVEILVEERTINAIAYVPNPGSRDRGYVSITQVPERSEQAREIVVREMQRVGSALQRARSVAAALALEDEIDLLLRQAIHVEKRAARPPPKPKGPKGKGPKARA